MTEPNEVDVSAIERLLAKLKRRKHQTCPKCGLKYYSHQKDTPDFVCADCKKKDA